MTRRRPKVKRMKATQGWSVVDQYNEAVTWYTVFSSHASAVEHKNTVGAYPHIGPLRIARVIVRELPRTRRAAR